MFSKFRPIWWCTEFSRVPSESQSQTVLCMQDWQASSGQAEEIASMPDSFRMFSGHISLSKGSQSTQISHAKPVEEDQLCDNHDIMIISNLSSQPSGIEYCGQLPWRKSDARIVLGGHHWIQLESGAAGKSLEILLQKRGWEHSKPARKGTSWQRL